MVEGLEIHRGFEEFLEFLRDFLHALDAAGLRDLLEEIVIGEAFLAHFFAKDGLHFQEFLALQSAAIIA